MNERSMKSKAWPAGVLAGVLGCGMLAALGADAPPQPTRTAQEEFVILTPKPGPEPKVWGPRVYGCRPGKPFLYRIPA